METEPKLHDLENDTHKEKERKGKEQVTLMEESQRGGETGLPDDSLEQGAKGSLGQATELQKRAAFETTSNGKHKGAVQRLLMEKQTIGEQRPLRGKVWRRQEQVRPREGGTLQVTPQKRNAEEKGESGDQSREELMQTKKARNLVFPEGIILDSQYNTTKKDGEEAVPMMKQGRPAQ
ncbi:unnamed protein product [Linum trigynum]|uniref:Uncharacterized protein n=1 Tax=Linum trigynum TaxID=586398 RepID=A0AAV2CHJ6_9ROSI